MKVSLFLLESSCVKTKQKTNFVLGEGHFDDGSNRPSGAATPVPGEALGPKGKKPRKAGGKKAKTAKQRLAMADGDVDMG